MTISSRTPEGSPNRCPDCGKDVSITPSDPAGDATCPHCGSLLSFTNSTASSHDTIRKLADRGVDVDAEGQITCVRFSGRIYNDSIIEQLAALGDIETIDLRDTSVTATGAQRLRRLLPNATIHR